MPFCGFVCTCKWLVFSNNRQRTTLIANRAAGAAAQARTQTGVSASNSVNPFGCLLRYALS